MNLGVFDSLLCGISNFCFNLITTQLKRRFQFVFAEVYQLPGIFLFVKG